MAPVTTPLKTYSLFLLALGGALLQYLCFFPFNWGILGWIALVPWLLLMRLPTSQLTPWILYLGALSLNLAQLKWMTVADVRMIGTWLLLAWWCSLFPMAAYFLIRRLTFRWQVPLALSVPVVWVTLEYAKSFLMTGFPWYFLAHTQHESLPLIQSADFASTQALSFVVGMANGWVADLILCRLKLDNVRIVSRGTLAVTAAVTLALISGMWGYGIWRINTIKINNGPTVALLQGNHAQSVRNSEEHFRQTWLDYKSMLATAKSLQPDLIVWPETSFPFELPARIDSPGPILGQNDEQEIWSGPPQLLGVNVAVYEGRDVISRHNSSMLQDFKTGNVTRYDKIHRVPFGEYIPFKDWIPAMNWLSPYDFDYSIRAGVEATRFPLAWNGQNLSFCALLCYEDSDFAQTRWAMNSAPPPDFWVNQSNDGWFQGTEEHAQHLATARFRTIETRRSMARAVNSGISALIDPLGRILAPSPIEGNTWRANASPAEVPYETWDRFKAMDMVLVGELPLCSAKAPYLILGDWVAWLCIVLVGAGLFIRPRSARPT